MPSIFDLVTATEVASYWELFSKDRAPYLGEELFPNDKKLGLDLSWIKGSAGIPVVLKPSAFDAVAVPRARIGFDKLSAEMPFFKESLYIDEQLRQQLNMVLATGNQNYIDAVLNRVFNDSMNLIEGAAAQRERMRMMMLTTGAISISANGQSYTYDYGLPSSHKATVTTSWSTTTADIGGDILEGIAKIEDDTGVTPARAVCGRGVWANMLANEKFIKSVFVLSNGNATLTDSQLKQHLLDAYGIDVVVNTKLYKDESGDQTKYVPDDTFVLFPAGKLGTTWFGTTPEESDLMSGSVMDAMTSLVDTGVAVTTMKRTDPVNVETKATMISLPSFEAADSVYILDTTA